MPHIIIELAKPLLTSEDDTHNLLHVVHNATKATQLFEPKNIKTRIIPVDYYCVADGTKSFIHAQLRIHPGRTDAQKRLLSQTIRDAIVQQKMQADVITIEVVDMDKSTYAKHVLNT